MAGTAVLTLAMAACGDDPKAGDDDSPSESTSAGTGTEAPRFTDDVCKPGGTSAENFKVGGILPQTGTLAYLDPPVAAGVGLAVSDINAAGGVNGKPACRQVLDSGDSADLSTSAASAAKLIKGKPSVVIGPEDSTMTLNVIEKFTDNKILEVSPAATSADLSGYGPYFFRTVPPDSIQGRALWTQISTDGHQKIGFLVFDDTYGTGLRDFVQQTIEAADGSCTYGCTGAGEEFEAQQTNFSAEVQAVIATEPDAIVVLAFDETKAIVPELQASGWDMSKTYYSDGNTANYSKDFVPGTLDGAQGSIPGNDPDDAFKALTSGFSVFAGGAELTDFSFAAESYDAVILAALAAAKVGSNESSKIKDAYAAVSGATNGEPCATYAECLPLLAGGGEIHYTGPSGIGPLDVDNEPSSAFVSIYKFNADNVPEVQSAVEGSKS
jgi:branched-chain amino acid transport system substrate-binding protein